MGVSNGGADVQIQISGGKQARKPLWHRIHPPSLPPSHIRPPPLSERGPRLARRLSRRLGRGRLARLHKRVVAACSPPAAGAGRRVQGGGGHTMLVLRHGARQRDRPKSGRARASRAEVACVLVCDLQRVLGLAQQRVQVDVDEGHGLHHQLTRELLGLRTRDPHAQLESSGARMAGPFLSPQCQQYRSEICIRISGKSRSFHRSLRPAAAMARRRRQGGVAGRV